MSMNFDLHDWRFQSCVNEGSYTITAYKRIFFFIENTPTHIPGCSKSSHSFSLEQKYDLTEGVCKSNSQDLDFSSSITRNIFIKLQFPDF